MNQREKFKKRIFNKLGFTLVELIVSLAITSIILLISTQTVVKLIRTAAKTDLRSEIERNGTYLIDILKKNIGEVSSDTGFKVENCYSDSSNIRSCVNGVNTNCSSSSPCNTIITENKLFYSYKDVSSPYNTLFYQCDIVSFNCTNILSSDVLISSFAVSYTTSNNFVQIILKLYDINQVIYTITNSYDIVTGIIVKFIYT